MDALGLAPDQLEALTDVFVAKAESGCGHIEDPGERLRAVVQQVILDTELLVRGDVPLERWIA